MSLTDGLAFVLNAENVVCLVTYSNQVSRSSNYSFEAAGSPIVDSCSIVPNSGYAMKTDFTISCIGAVGNTPLSYTFTLHVCTTGGVGK